MISSLSDAAQDISLVSLSEQTRLNEFFEQKEPGTTEAQAAQFLPRMTNRLS